MSLFLKNLLFTVLVPGVVAAVVPVWVFDHPQPGVSMPSIVGGVLLAIGAAIYTWCVWDFATSGRGTPAPIDPPKTLIVRGLYRFTRNPMYVGVLTVIAGWVLVFRSFRLAVYAVGVAVCFHLFVVLSEEPKLKRLFGGAYDEYCSAVGRWIPK
jgi:protein-S-isoprenylcysteine O-methyltransferase Ste14